MSESEAASAATPWPGAGSPQGGVLLRLTAFTKDPAGGNPAGVWLGDALPDAAAMQRIAADVGFSETAFLAPAAGPERTVRYYSPAAEVSFCGHATIAAGVALGERDGVGTYRLHTAVGVVPVVVRGGGGEWVASLTSVAPAHEAVPPEALDEVLAVLGWSGDALDPAIPPARAYAGAWHLVLAVRTREQLASLAYDFARLRALMLGAGLTTLQLVWREGPDVFQARNPFPVGGVVEDPATGAAAAALGGYLRDAGLLTAPARLRIHQGDFMGRPSLITVDVPRTGGIVVSGSAVPVRAGAPAAAAAPAGGAPAPHAPSASSGASGAPAPG